MDPKSDGRPTGLGFLLAQIGAHGARRFGDRLQEIGLTASEAGILRIVSFEPGISQQALAERLGVLPSRMVILIDGLEDKELIERRPSLTDRRASALHIKQDGQGTLRDLFRIAGEHERDLCAALDDDERRQLANLCRRIADQQGLTPNVHPGYRGE